MSLYQVIIQPEAEAELDEAYAFFESQQAGLGFELLANLSETISLLEDNPLIFQKYMVKSVELLSSGLGIM